MVSKHGIVLTPKKLVAIAIGMFANIYASVELLRLIHSFTIHIRWLPGFWWEVPVLIYGLIFPFVLCGWIITKSSFDKRLNRWVIACRSFIAKFRVRRK